MSNGSDPSTLWKEANGLGPCVYIATSAGLHEWARANGVSYLFKIGRTRMAAERAMTLNGRAWFGPAFGRAPCLGFADWRITPCMDFHYPHRARRIEGQVKRGLWRAFEAFDPRPLIGDRPPANGESEICRLRPEALEHAIAHAGSAISNRHVAPRVQLVVAAAVAEIGRYEATRASGRWP